MNATPPLVSVIVPAYNAQAFIKETLKSVLSQTHANLEVLVVDDGSTDATPMIVQEVAHQDQRVILRRQRNHGAAAARNLAIRESRGEYIAPVDADDLWFPSKLERQVARLQGAGPAAGVAYTWSLNIDSAGHFIGERTAWSFEGDVYQALVLRNFLGNASVPLIRRGHVEAVGGYDERFRQLDGQGCEDWDLYLRLAERCEFRVVPEFLVCYRLHPGGMSSSTHQAMGRSYHLLLEKVETSHPEIHPRLFRWSRGQFYLHLSGLADSRASFTWLLRAVLQDRAVLMQPWLTVRLAKGFVRLFVSLILAGWGREALAWRQLPRRRNAEPRPLSLSQIVAGEREPPPNRLWQRVQARRFAVVTKGNPRPRR